MSRKTRAAAAVTGFLIGFSILPASGQTERIELRPKLAQGETLYYWAAGRSGRVTRIVVSAATALSAAISPPCVLTRLVK